MEEAVRMEFPEGRFVLLDCETTGLHPEHGAQVWAIGWTIWEKGEYDEVRLEVSKVHPRTRFSDFKPSPELEELLESETPKVAHNAIFDLDAVHNLGARLGKNFSGGLWYDTMVMSNLLGVKGRGLKEVSRRLGYDGGEEKKEEELKKAVTSLRMTLRNHYSLGDEWQSDMWILVDNPPFHKIFLSYLEQDVRMLAHVWTEILRREEEGQFEFIRRDAEVLKVLFEDVTSRGLRIDMEELTAQAAEVRKKIAEYEEIFKREAKERFGIEADPSNMKQVRELVFSSPPRGMGVVPESRTSSGAPSLDFGSLSESRDPMLRSLGAYHLYRHYLTSELERIRFFAEESGGTHRVRPRFIPSGASTGRMSCKDPNIQQVPDPVTQPQASVPLQCRRIFVPDEGKVWLGIDYKQMEARAIAGISQDEEMIVYLMDESKDLFEELAYSVWGGKEAVSKDKNLREASLQIARRIIGFHLTEPSGEKMKKVWDRLGWVAGDLEGRKIEDVARWLDEHDWVLPKAEKELGTKTARGLLKNTFYAVLYGGSPRSVSSQSKIDEGTALRFIKELERRYSTAFRWAKATIDFAAKYGSVYSAFGRRIAVEQGSSYKAVNYVVQGTCADMMKLAILRISAILRERGVGRVVATMHDELVLEVERPILEDSDFLARLELAFCDFSEYMPVSFPCDMEYYERWGEVVPLHKEGGRWTL